MGLIVHDYIEEYIRSVLPKQREEILKLEEYAETNHVPIIHPEVGQFMRMLLKLTQSKSLLEVGTAIGYSASVFCDAMGKGTVVTIERNTKLIELAKENIDSLGFSDYIEIIEGEAEEVLPTIKGSFDCIFLDAAKGKYMEFLPFCIDLLKDGGILVSDNVLFRGMVATDSLVIRRKKTIVKRMREYLDYISHHEYLETSIVPIGDGVAISYKGGKS